MEELIIKLSLFGKVKICKSDGSMFVLLMDAYDGDNMSSYQRVCKIQDLVTSYLNNEYPILVKLNNSDKQLSIVLKK